jgi:hypothetical protein
MDGSKASNGYSKSGTVYAFAGEETADVKPAAAAKEAAPLANKSRREDEALAFGTSTIFKIGIFDNHKYYHFIKKEGKGQKGVSSYGMHGIYSFF